MSFYNTVDGESRITYEINRSVFICTVRGIKSYEEGLAFVGGIKKEFSSATHNCYAINMRTGEQKFFDDGEPGGTAGQPILQVLKRKEILDVAAVVTRYFGGIKLGAGGLVSAYAESTARAIDEAKVIKLEQSAICEAVCDYSDYASVNNLLRGTKSITLDTEYGNEVKIAFAIPTEDGQRVENSISEITSGRVKMLTVREEYKNYE